jgi:glutamate-1-semialdehyde 2,1-aminomutase
MTQKLACRYTELSEKYSIPLSVNKVGSLMCVFFTGGGVCSFDEAKKSDTALYADYFNGMLKEGIYLAPSQFEAMFVSAAHTEADIEKTLEAAERVIAAMAEKR